MEADVTGAVAKGQGCGWSSTWLKHILVRSCDEPVDLAAGLQRRRWSILPHLLIG